MKEALGDDPRFREADRRIDEFFEDVAKKEDKRKFEEAQSTSKGVSSGSGLTDEERTRSRVEEAEGGREREEGNFPFRISPSELNPNFLKEQEEENENKKRRLQGVQALCEGDAGNHIVYVSAVYETNDDEEEDEWQEEEEHTDQRTGKHLDPELVRSARLEEIKFMEKIGLYEEATIEQCWEMTGKSPISTKWVDIDKGAIGSPDVRCRLVARDFKPRGERDREDLFAAMPPLEAKKLLFQKAVNENAKSRAEGGEGVKLMLIDIKKAHLNGFLTKDECAFVMLPNSKCVRLRRWLYGMRPAASTWEKDYSEKLSALGFKKGVAAPTVFYCESKNVRCVVHGDDFTFTGKKATSR